MLSGVGFINLLRKTILRFRFVSIKLESRAFFPFFINFTVYAWKVASTFLPGHDSSHVAGGRLQSEVSTSPKKIHLNQYGYRLTRPQFSPKMKINSRQEFRKKYKGQSIICWMGRKSMGHEGQHEKVVVIEIIENVGSTFLNV